MKKILIFSLSIIGHVMAMEVEEENNLQKTSISETIQIAQISSADVKLEVNGTTFLCTKSILGQWSSSFTDLFSDESTSYNVNIFSDEEMTSFTTFLRIIHKTEIKTRWTVLEIIKHFDVLKKLNPSNSGNDDSLKTAQESFIKDFADNGFSISQPDKRMRAAFESVDGSCKNFITNHFIGKRLEKLYPSDDDSDTFNDGETLFGFLFKLFS